MILTAACSLRAAPAALGHRCAPGAGCVRARSRLCGHLLAHNPACGVTGQWTPVKSTRARVLKITIG